MIEWGGSYKRDGKGRSRPRKREAHNRSRRGTAKGLKEGRGTVRHKRVREGDNEEIDALQRFQRRESRGRKIRPGRGANERNPLQRTKRAQSSEERNKNSRSINMTQRGDIKTHENRESRCRTFLKSLKERIDDKSGGSRRSNKGRKLHKKYVY